MEDTAEAFGHLSVDQNEEVSSSFSLFQLGLTRPIQ